MINRGLKHLHAEMLRVDGQGYFEFDSSFNTVNLQEFYALPAAVLQVVKVWMIIDGMERVLSGYEPYETDGLRPGMTVNGLANQLPCWRLVSNTISIRPTLNSVQAIFFRYKGTPIPMVLSTDSVDGLDGFDEFIVDWAARRIAIKDDRMDLAGTLSGQIAEGLDRLRATVKFLNRSQPQRMVDTRGDSTFRHYGRAWRGMWGTGYR